MKNVKYYSAILAFGLMTAAGSAQAMKIELGDVDLNDDGKVTEAEIVNVIKQHFLMMDADSDAAVSSDEWLANENSNK